MSWLILVFNADSDKCKLVLNSSEIIYLSD
jgi:hypothetical protein